MANEDVRRNDIQLDRGSDLWKQLDVTKVLALHIAGDFPGLQLELWALKP